jgi:alpha-glucosidase
MWVDADIDSMPIFVKEGAVIPKYPIQQYVGEKEITEITLDVYYKKGKEKSELYSDANDGYDYTKGRYSLRTFILTGRSNELIINQHKEGKFITPYETFKLKIHGLPFEIGEFQLDNETVSLDTIKMNGTHTFVVDKNFSELHIISK